MRKVALAIVAAGFATPVFAADLPVKAPAVAVSPAYDWTGFYAGLNAGADWGHYGLGATVPGGTNNINGAATAAALAAGNGSVDKVGFTGGGQVGYNRQLIQGLVVGIEGDIVYLGDRATRDTGVLVVGGSSIQDVDRLSHDWLATVRGKIGFTTGPALLYATGGVAFTDVHFARTQAWSFADGCPITANGLELCHAGSVSETRTGWAAGLGGEYMFGSNWSAKLEYLHARFDASGFTTMNVSVPNQAIIHSVRSDIDIVRAGINWHFGGPVVAKY